MKADTPSTLGPRPRKRKEEADPSLSSPVPSRGFSTPSSGRPSHFRWRRSHSRPQRGGALRSSRSREHSVISRYPTPDLCARETPSFPFPWLAARRPHGKRGLWVAAVRGATGPGSLALRARAGDRGKPGAGSLRPLEPRPRASGRPGHARSPHSREPSGLGGQRRGEWSTRGRGLTERGGRGRFSHAVTALRRCDPCGVAWRGVGTRPLCWTYRSRAAVGGK